MEQDSAQTESLRAALDGVRALVVGGSGFIGRAVTTALASLGAETVALGLRPDAPIPDHPRISRLTADITDRSRLATALAGQRFDYAVNLGGYIHHAPYLQGGRAVLDAHFGGLENLLEFLGSSSLKGFVQVGSSDEYGNTPAPQAEDQREAPISPYSAAKTAATHLVQALARSEGFPGVVVRYFLVYGPGQDARRFLPQIIQGALADREFPTSTGQQLRDFCYLKDATRGTLLALTQPKAKGEVINIASGNPVSIREVIETVVRLVGRGRPQFGVHSFRTGENMALYADVTKARTLLGWQADTSLSEGLAVTIAWFRQRTEDA